MPETPITAGDQAPDFTLLGALDGEVGEMSLESLLEGRRGLVLTTYLLDFTGG